MVLRNVVQEGLAVQGRRRPPRSSYRGGFQALAPTLGPQGTLSMNQRSPCLWGACYSGGAADGWERRERNAWWGRGRARQWDPGRGRGGALVEANACSRRSREDRGGMGAPGPARRGIGARGGEAGCAGAPAVFSTQSCLLCRGFPTRSPHCAREVSVCRVEAAAPGLHPAGALSLPHLPLLAEEWQ